MAKIYETQKDFEQDKLKEQSKDTYLKSAGQAGTGMASVLLGSVVRDFNTKGTGGLKAVSAVLNIVGIVEVVRSFFTASKAHDLAMQKERLGPQTVVFPPEVSMGGDVMNGTTSCSKCKHTQNIKPTTLLEQAVKTDSVVMQK